MESEIDFAEKFNDSFELVRRSNTEFYSIFYERFVNSSYSVKLAFSNTDMDKQKAMLKTALVLLVNFFVSKKASPDLIHLARMHYELNIRSEMYELFINALLFSLSEIDPNFNNKTAVAWRVTLSPGIEFMKHFNDFDSSD